MKPILTTFRKDPAAYALVIFIFLMASAGVLSNLQLTTAAQQSGTQKQLCDMASRLMGG